MIPLIFLKNKKTSYKMFLLKLLNERANLSCFFCDKQFSEFKTSLI